MIASTQTDALPGHHEFRAPDNARHTSRHVTTVEEKAPPHSHVAAGALRNGDELRQLSDRELLFRIELATRRERAMTIRILHHLNEIDRRKLYLELGHGSLFDYCTRRLKYSSSAAGRRIQTARCIRRYPEVLLMLQERELSLSTVSLIAPILTDENRAAILARVRGRSHREVDRVVSQYRPPVAMRDRVRSVRVAVRQPAAGFTHVPDRQRSTTVPEQLRPLDVDRALVERDLERQLPHVPPPPVPSEALAGSGTPGAGSASWIGIEQKLFVQFLASEDLMKKFEEVRALLSHRCGDGSFAAVLDLVLTDFVERHSAGSRSARRERKNARAKARKENAKTSRGATDGRQAPDQCGARDRPETTDPDAGRCEQDRRGTTARTGAGTAGHSRRRERMRSSAGHTSKSADAPRRYDNRPSRHIPAAIRDQVFIRDAGRCTFIARDGTRCGSKHLLQIDHMQPFAVGGSHDPANLRLLCAKHNRLAAEQHLGKHVMRPFWRTE